MTHRHIPELRWVVSSPSRAHGKVHAKGEATAIARGDELVGVPAEAFGAAGKIISVCDLRCQVSVWDMFIYLSV